VLHLIVRSTKRQADSTRGIERREALVSRVPGAPVSQPQPGDRLVTTIARCCREARVLIRRRLASQFAWEAYASAAGPALGAFPPLPDVGPRLCPESDSPLFRRWTRNALVPFAFLAREERGTKNGERARS
jgi:hypothetical protein